MNEEQRNHMPPCGNEDMEKMRNTYLEAKRIAEGYHLECFENVLLSGFVIPFVFSTEKCAFLINMKTNNSVLRDCYVLWRAMKFLCEMQPMAKVFGIKCEFEPPYTRFPLGNDRSFRDFPPNFPKREQYPIVCLQQKQIPAFIKKTLHFVS